MDAVAELIPPDCACEWIAVEEASISAVHPDEISGLGRVGAARLADFVAGRQACRAAQLRLGLLPRPVLIGRKGEPCWPSGIAGSITHSAGMAGAVVVRVSERCAVGIDLAE